MSTDIPDDGTWASDMAWAEQVDREMALTHTCALVEEHEIVVPIADVGDEDTAHNVAYMHAQAWLRAHGLEAEIEADPTAEDGYAGVYFEVMVGKGDISLDQRLPGVLDSWRWSARFEWWRKVFNRMDGRQGRHLAEVSKIRPRDPDNYESLARQLGYGTSGGGGGRAVLGDPHRTPGAVRGPMPNPDIVPAWLDAPPPWLRRGTGWDEDDDRDTPMGDAPPPWLRRGTGWDEDDDRDTPMGEGLPPGLR